MIKKNYEHLFAFTLRICYSKNKKKMITERKRKGKEELWTSVTQEK